MLKATWMMKFLKSRNLEVIQTLRVVWRKEGFDSRRLYILYILNLFFFGEVHMHMHMHNLTWLDS